MQRETIAVNARAQWRLYVLNDVLAGETSAAEAATCLGLSVRSVRRLLAGYRAEGVVALVHGNAGRVPSNRVQAALRAQLVELALSTYAGVNRAHLADLLAEREQISVPARTLRRILAQAHLPAVRTRRARHFRLRRERMSAAGMLLQVDGSYPDWLEGRGPWLTLVGGIDDATGVVTGAVFREHEDAAGYLEVLQQTARSLGVPVSLPVQLADGDAGQRLSWLGGRRLGERGHVDRPAFTRRRVRGADGAGLDGQVVDLLEQCCGSSAMLASRPQRTTTHTSRAWMQKGGRSGWTQSSGRRGPLNVSARIEARLADGGRA